MKCKWCGGSLVERKPMVHDTRKGDRAKLTIRQPRARYFCPSCKRVSMEPA
jgi:hypothetical protein